MSTHTSVSFFIQQIFTVGHSCTGCSSGLQGPVSKVEKIPTSVKLPVIVHIGRVSEAQGGVRLYLGFSSSSASYWAGGLFEPQFSHLQTGSSSSYCLLAWL